MTSATYGVAELVYDGWCAWCVWRLQGGAHVIVSEHKTEAEARAACARYNAGEAE